MGAISPAGSDMSTNQAAREFPQVPVHGKRQRYRVMGAMRIVLHGTKNGAGRSCSTEFCPMDGYLKLGKSRAGFRSCIAQVAGFGSVFGGKVYGYGMSSCR
jgi:hypothetical protein